ncbi:hypothetical protein RB195_025448 [Necator americanus]|uniref:Reverse transcriptase domain-containing protein n=1 Tax=Necator americanus TaxID=51031 RepID=A0ABR1ESC4_NECAM
MQLAFLDFEAAFDSPHRGRLLNALRSDGVPGKFVRLLDDMNQRTTAAVRTPAGCTTPVEVETVNQCPADIVLAPSGCPLTDLEYADDVVIFAESSTKLQHVVNLVSKLAAAYGLRLRPDKCKQMWTSSKPRTGIRVDGQPTELVDELCYLGCMLKNNGSYKRNVQQRCAKATSAFNSLTKCLWSTPITNEVKLRVYLSAIRSIMMYGSETWVAPSRVMEKLDCTERKLLRRLIGYFRPRVCHNEDLYVEIDVVYRRMTRGRHQHLAPPSKVAKVNRLRFFGHILRRPADRLVQRVLKSSSGSSWKKPPGGKRKFWNEVVKEDLRTFGVDGQFRREVRFRRIWNSDEWIDSVQALAEDREGWAELCSRTAHLDEDAGVQEWCSGGRVIPEYIIKANENVNVYKLPEGLANAQGEGKDERYTYNQMCVVDGTFTVLHVGYLPLISYQETIGPRIVEYPRRKELLFPETPETLTEIIEHLSTCNKPVTSFV